MSGLGYGRRSIDREPVEGPGVHIEVDRRSSDEGTATVTVDIGFPSESIVEHLCGTDTSQFMIFFNNQHRSVVEVELSGRFDDASQ